MSDIQIKRALIAVYDKTGIAEFARSLVDEFGIEIISTGGTARHLKQAGIPVTMVEQVTGFPEMLDGRVKTLHPMVHAAILADRDNPEHMRQLAEHGIRPIDMVVVNLYPFEQTVARPDCTFDEAIEMIDIGGPCLLRAAAKNHKHVVVAPVPDCCDRILNELRDRGRMSAETRRQFAAITFGVATGYNSAIAQYLLAENGSFPANFLTFHNKLAEARYGENPAQAAAVYGDSRRHECGLLARGNVGGRGCSRPLIAGEMSFNNYVDGDSALALVKELSREAPRLVGPASCRSDEGVEPSSCESDSNVGPASCRSESWAPAGMDSHFRRHLPHIENPGQTYFVTFKTRQLELTPEARDAVLAACNHWHGKRMNLHIGIVMPDHVHLLLTPYLYESGEALSLGQLLHSIKSYSAKQVNRIMRRSGTLWRDERWDRIMRHEREFEETWEYIETNPDRAGLGSEYKWIWRSTTGFEEAGLLQPDRQDAGPTEAGSIKTHAVAFIKHTNACGCAIGDDPIDTYRRAYLGDPIAAAGGVLCMNFPVTRQIADAVMNSFGSWGKAAGAAFFKLDVWIAPAFDDDALELITTPTEKRKWGASCRLLAVGAMDTPPDENELDYKKITGGMLVQTRDLIGLNEDQWKVVTKRAPSPSEMSDLRFAWLVCKHTKSNAITICKDRMLLGNGAGQMSRVKSCDLAIQLARENGHADRLKGAVAAGDAFFPVPDGPARLIEAGITAVIHPGGSNRDAESIALCDAADVAMVITGTRHFKH